MNHVLGSRTVELNAEHRAMGTAAADQLEALWRTRLGTDTEQLFSAACPAGERIRIPRLELTLGTIAAGDFATEFPARYRRALQEELLRAVAQRHDPGRPHGAGVAPEAGAAVELLEHVLLHGALPWWASGADEIDPPAELAALVHRAAAAAAALARRIGRHSQARFRIVRWLADPEIAALIRAVAPGDAEFILRYAADLSRRQREEPLVPATNEDFRHAKWEVILGHLLADAGSRFNAKAFLRQTLRALAARFRAGYAAVLSDLSRLARDVAVAWSDASLPALLAELYAEDVAPLAETGTAGAADAEGAAPLRLSADDAIALWQAAWDELAAGAALSTAARSELMFWRELAPAEAADAAAHLAARFGPAPFAAQVNRLFAASERAALAAALRAAARAHSDAAGLAAAGAAEGPAREASASRPEQRGLVERLAGEISEPAAALELPPIGTLRTVLETGTLPPELSARAGLGELRGWVQWMLAEYAEAVPALLREWSRPGKLPRALAANFDRTVLGWVVEAVEPGHAEEVTGFVDASVHAHARESVVPVPVSTFEREVWTIVLEYLLSDRGSVFNTRSFLAHNIEALAARCGLGRAAVIAFLVEAAAAEGRHTLLRDLRALAEGSGIVVNGGGAAGAPGPAGPELLARSAVARQRWLKLLLSGAGQGGRGLTAAELRQLWQLAAGDPALIAILRCNTVERGAAARLIGHGGETLLRAAVFAGDAAAGERWDEAVSWLEESRAAAALFQGSRAGLRAALWEALLEAWRQNGGRRLTDPTSLLVRLLLRLNQRGGAGPRLAPALRGEWAIYVQLRDALSAEDSRSAQALAERLRAPLRPARRPPESPAMTPAAAVPVLPPAEAAPPERIFVDNAGLVMLAPFFPALFERCGLADAKKFGDFRAAQRAVHLLQHLVTGGGKRAHEHSLVLNKLFCGLDPAAGVVLDIELSERERTAAAQLLDSVVARWPRGSISAGGLRGSFLVRPGRLEHREERWHLWVERRGWDILLAELDWAFPGRRPPWMPEPIEVDWI